jgi:acyl dehydratase
MLNRALIGRSYQADFPFDVSRQKLREFADAIGDPAPAYRDVDAARRLGHPDLLAPPTFASVVSLAVGLKARRDPQLGLDYSRVVHGEQRIIAQRPIYAGDVLGAVARIDTIQAKGRNELLAISCRILDADGDPVCEVISLLVSRGTAS